MLCGSCSPLVNDLLDLNFSGGRWSTTRSEAPIESYPGGPPISHGHWGHDGQWYTARHLSVQELCIKSIHECPLCRLIAQQFGFPTDGDCDEEILQPFQTSVWFEAQVKPLTQRSIFNVFIRDAWPAVQHFEFFNISGPPCIPGIKLRRAASENTNSDSAFALASRWLHSCINTHPDCIRSVEMVLPTRVIDVSGRPNRPRLIVVDDSTRGRYVTLSHCWGDTGSRNRLVTTNEKLEEYCTTGLPYEELPKTFQDAIVITRRLGYRYLWIDSFCIIQDSKEDWATQAGCMSQVYENADVCISALFSEDSFAGIFLEDEDAVGRPLPGLSYRDKAGEVHDIGIRPESATCQDLLRLGTLSTRAWVAQERILSTAILHYAPGSVAWECRTCFTTDTEGDIGRVSHPLVKCMQLAEEAATNTLFYGGYGLLWCQVVQEYTRRSLTYGEDKITAIIGLAVYFRQLQSQRFLAGIWREDLHRGLLWERPYSLKGEHVHVLERHDVGFQVAPSWSWASVQGEITYNWTSDHPLVYQLPSRDDARILNARVIGSEVSGPCSGDLKLFGQFARAYYRPLSGPWADPGSGFVQNRPFASRSCKRFRYLIARRRTVVHRSRQKSTSSRHTVRKILLNTFNDMNLEQRIPRPRTGIPTISDMFPSTHKLISDRERGVLALTASMDFDWEQPRECYVVRIATWVDVDERGELQGQGQTHFLILERAEKHEAKVEGNKMKSSSSSSSSRRRGPLRAGKAKGLRHEDDVGRFYRIGHGADAPESVEVFFGEGSERVLVVS